MQGKPRKELPNMFDIGPPIGLMAIGLILWLAVTATVAGISIQTIGLILFVIAVVWLVIEIATNRPRRSVPPPRERVVERPVAREREVL
jgi:hypothetical protein